MHCEIKVIRLLSKVFVIKFEAVFSVDVKESNVGNGTRFVLRRIDMQNDASPNPLSSHICSACYSRKIKKLRLFKKYLTGNCKNETII